MRILIVTGKFPLLSQGFIKNKVIALAERGNYVTVMASNPGDDEIDRRTLSSLSPYLKIRYILSEDGVVLRVLRLPLLFLQALYHDLGYTLRLVGALRKRVGFGKNFVKKLYRLLPFAGVHTDILHFEWATKAAEYAELVKLIPSRTVMSCRGSDIRIMPLNNPRLVEDIYWLFSEVDRVHCVSEAVLSTARDYGLDERKAFINYPSVDSNFFCPPRNNFRKSGTAIRIITTGRLHWVKGFDYALKAIRLLLDRRRLVRYTIIGDGDNDSKAQILFSIKDMNLQEVVEVLGPRPREGVLDVLSKSDIYLLSSLSEGLSNSVLEAMAMELPVVTTDAGGMAEAVRDGTDGFVVPSRDAEKMANSLDRLIQDEQLRLQMGRNGRKHIIENFTIEKQIERFINFYESLLQEGKESGNIS